MGKDVKIGLSALAILFGLLGYVCYHKFNSPKVHSSDALARLRAKFASGDEAANVPEGAEAAMPGIDAGMPTLDADAAAAASSAWASTPADDAVDPAQYTASADESAAVAAATGHADPGAGQAWTIEDEPLADGPVPADDTAPGDASPFGPPGDFGAIDDSDSAAADRVASDELYETEAAAAAQGAALATEEFAPAEWQGGEPAESAASAEPYQQPTAGQSLGEASLEDEPLDGGSSDEAPYEASPHGEPLMFDEGEGAPPADSAGADGEFHNADSTAGDVRLAAGRQPNGAAGSEQPHSLFQRVEEKIEEVEHGIAEGVTDAAHRVADEAHQLYDAATHRNAPHPAGQQPHAAEPPAYDAQQYAATASEPYAAAPIDRPHERDEYVVQPNDNYWVISKQLYGTGAYFKALYELNRKQFPRADRLKTGDVILAPSVEVLAHRFPDLCPTPQHHQALTQQRAATRAVSQRGHLPAGARIYVVEEGDTLFDIARYELGKATRWAEIYDLNRDVLGEDMDYLRPGTQLVLPQAGGYGTESDSITQRPADAYRR
ncbi:MAG: LysM peptidoglycan-binding domain-containing protein [Pirellulales bacterium]